VKEFIQNVRDYKANALMVLLPIVLITILGAAFSGLFSNTISLDDEKVLYKVDVAENAQFAAAFENFCKILNDETGIVFEKAEDVEAARADTENHAYSALVHITENPLQINLYKNERAGFGTTLMENSLNSFIKTYDAMIAIAVNNPSAFGKVQVQEYKEYVRVRSLDPKRHPGSTDYYSTTMLTLIMLYSSLTGFWAIRGEIEQKTAPRILCSPVRSFELLTGKVIGCISITIVQGLVVVLFSKWVLNAYWGQDILPVALLILTYAFMTVSIGVALAFLIRNGDAASGILNTLIPVLVFLGGGYVPLSVMNGFVVKIAQISPVYWINSALFKIIYDRDFSGIPVSIAINLGIAILSIIISAIFSKRGKMAYA
jgi:ABC-2 type transport system permease protein